MRFFIYRLFRSSVNNLPCLIRKVGQFGRCADQTAPGPSRLNIEKMELHIIYIFAELFQETIKRICLTDMISDLVVPTSDEHKIFMLLPVFYSVPTFFLLFLLAVFFLLFRLFFVRYRQFFYSASIFNYSISTENNL